MSRVKVGVVGLGQRGLQHLNALWQLADAESVALCDPATENLKEEKIKKFVSGYQQGSSRLYTCCLLYTSPSPRDGLLGRMPASA